MTRRFGWIAFAVVALVAFVTSAIGGAFTIGIQLVDGSPFSILMAAGTTILWLVFWRWIGLGAWLRAHPPLGEDGLPVRTLEPIGPWGIVGQVLLSLMVIGFTTLMVWGTVAEQRSNQRAERVRVDAERIARSADLTVADVNAASLAYSTWAWSAADAADPGASPFDELLTVPDAYVTDASVTDDGAAILIRPDGEGPPCVVVTIDNDELIRSRLTDDCP